MTNRGAAMTIEEKADQLVQQAEKLASQATSWTEFSNRVFAQDDGLVAKAFPRMTERRAFYQRAEYDQLNQMLLSLMKRFGIEQNAAPKKSGKFVVRVPKTLHASLEVEAKQEGVSLNQLALSKLSVSLREATKIDWAMIVAAYKNIYDGYSSDRILVHPEYNAKFVKECRELGLNLTDYAVNHELQKIRKSGKGLLPPATNKPRITDYDDFVYASEIAFRYLQRKESVSLDDVLCDPNLRDRFDEIAKRLTAERSVFKLRMGALYLRKTHRLKPDEPAAMSVDLRRVGRVADVRLSDVPEFPGLYAFYAHDRPIFASETSKLRKRIAIHLERSEKLFLPSWLELGHESDLELRFFAQIKLGTAERVRWLNQFINRERPTLNYQAA